MTTHQPPPPPDATVIARAVSRRFGSLVAVSEVTVSFRPGLTALLGPNGAGKSTLLRILSGQISPTNGEVWVAGGDPRQDPAARARIGLVPQQDGVFERERALDVVSLAAVLGQMDRTEERARQALELVELDADIERPLGTFSKGMRQRVKIAQALVTEPTVLLLDEPLNGLDPRQRRHMIELFASLADAGKTVIVSSHVLDEVERFGSRVVVIARGRLAAEGDFHQIRDLMDDRPARIRVQCSDPSRLAGELVASGAAIGCTVGPDTLELNATDLRRLRRELVEAAHRLGLRLDEVLPLDDDLESVFRYLVSGDR